MRSPDVESSIHAPFSIEPRFGQVPEYVVDASACQARDVLQEDGSLGSRVANDPGDERPEPTFVVGLGAFSRRAPGLAREARRDDVHDSTPRSSVEGLKVIPDRRRIQPPVFHARRQDCGRKGFPFDVTHGADSRAGGSETEIDPSNPGTEGDSVDGGT